MSNSTQTGQATRGLLGSTDPPVLDIPQLDIPVTGGDPPAADPLVSKELDVPGLGTDEMSVPALDTDSDLCSHAHAHSDATGDDPDQSDPSTWSDHTDMVDTIELPHLHMVPQYIDLLRTGTLENSGMQPDEIEDLRNPDQEITPLVEPLPLLRSILHFINNSTASRKHYESLRKIKHRHRPDDPILSFDQVKHRVLWLSGVVPMEHDMCVNSCLAFTGPHSTLDKCSHCSQPRYCPGTTKPQKRFTMIPVGPVIQAMYGSTEVAGAMYYLERKLADNAECARINGGFLDMYNDTVSSQELLDAYGKGYLKKGDVALQFSIDGDTPRTPLGV
jgi:hypothetical protein